MRKILTFCLVLLAILMVTPLITTFLLNENENTDENFTNTQTTAESSENALQTENVITLALDLVDEDFCEEALKAALAIAENNLNYQANGNDIPNVTAEADTTDDFYKKLEKLYKETRTSITYKNQRVYIPTSSLSNGSTKTDEKYPYIKAVASPWDCTDEDFVYEKEYSPGISMNGIDYLCKNGTDYKKALKWYLPDFNIK